MLREVRLEYQKVDTSTFQIRHETDHSKSKKVVYAWFKIDFYVPFIAQRVDHGYTNFVSLKRGRGGGV